ncbi:MAG TPA: hypothetical protein VLJ21_01130 [Candidatus Binatia bacterium]|nr:hypothetical protein [Candidatus Binatia bacterium]
MRSKRGATPPSGTAAGSVIGLMTLLLVFYIIFIPPEERHDLLYGDNTSSSAANTTANAKILLLANIGKLDYQAESKFEHSVPNVYLVETKNAQALEKFNPFVVQNGWFVDQKRTLTFTVAQPDLASNIKLVFDAPTRQGILTITLNGRVVFEGKPDAINVAPIDLKPEQLRGDNTLEFSVSGVGLAFWRVNEYEITNAQVIADITDTAKQESANIITLEPTEARNLQRATLTFFPICTQGQVGALEVLLNNQRVSNSVPDCETVNRVELDPNDLNTGKNTLLFKITEGNYRIEQIKLKTELKEGASFIDYFELNSTAFRDVQDKRKKLLLHIDFVDDDKEKKAEINVNGKRDYLEQRGPSYERDIGSFAVENNNYVEVVPKSDLNIVKLEVRLE